MSKITEELNRAVAEAGVFRDLEGPGLPALLNEHIAIIGNLVRAVQQLDERLDRAGL